MPQLGDFVRDFLAMWVVLDPITAVPVFIALTAGHDQATRRVIAGASVVVAMVILAFFICLGQIIITAIGVSLHAFQIAGGLILFLFSVELVIGQTKPPATDDLGGATPLQLAIYPLGVPTLAGPGAMMTVMLRTDNSHFSIAEQMHTAAAAVLVLAVTYLLLCGAGLVLRLIGPGGANIIKRVMGMILAAYAVTLVLEGLAAWLHLPPL